MKVRTTNIMVTYPVFGFSVVGKLVGRFAVWDLVHCEPFSSGLQHTVESKTPNKHAYVLPNFNELH